MQKIVFKLILKVRHTTDLISIPLDRLIVSIILYCNNIEFSTFISKGVPFVKVDLGGYFSIGKAFKMNNRQRANPIGRCNPCSIVVGGNGILRIGDNVGMSATAIVCHKEITIGDNTKIGGNVVIYDTDFHSLQAIDRLHVSSDRENTATAPVIIGNQVFIGAHSTILKGVIIGDRSIVGACSVVTKNIPSDQIWAGNPARFVRNLDKI